MNKSFKNVSFIFLLGFGVFYLGADFLLNQGGSDSETLQTIYETFDMPFFFSAGMYFLAAVYQQIQERFPVSGLELIFWILAVGWTIFLIYLNVGYESFL